VRQRVSQRLPDFPWDQLATAAERAHQHPDGLVDLSVGTPVDPTPDFVRRALADAADSPGYPLTIGRVETRQAALDWMERRLGVTGLGLDAVIPTIGSKELIASLPTHLGVRPGDLEERQRCRPRPRVVVADAGLAPDRDRGQARCRVPAAAVARRGRVVGAQA